MTDRPRRSALYMPASNAKAIEKARSLPCDVVILDLEDAVAPDAKEMAREQAIQAVKDGGFGRRELVIRVNGADTPWGEADIRAAAAARPDAILVPKVNSAADVAAAVCTNSRRVQDPAGDSVLMAKEKPGPTPAAIETRRTEANATAPPLGSHQGWPGSGRGPW